MLVRQMVWVCATLCALAATCAALPVIEIRSFDTDEGTDVKLLAVPLLREITVPETTFLIGKSEIATHVCGNSENPPSQPDDDVNLSKAPPDLQKPSESATVTLYV